MIRKTTMVLAAGAVLAGPAVAAEPILTGSAIYELSLDPSKGVGIASLSGTMTSRLTLECDVYVNEATLDSNLIAPDGSVVPLSVTSSSRETDEELVFDVTTSLAGVAIDTARGTAKRAGDELVVSLSSPTTKEVTLKGPVLFPVEVVEAAIAAAKAGRTFSEFRAYDGTGGGEEIWTVSALITPAGKATDADQDVFVEGLGFADLDHWRMALSYFAPSTGEQTPAFSTSMVVYENGFAQAAVYDMGQFAMRLDLTEFQPIASEPCP